MKSDQILYPDVSLEETNEPLNLQIDEFDEPGDDNDVKSSGMMVDKIDQLISENHSILNNPLKIKIRTNKKAFTSSTPAKERSAKSHSTKLNDLNNSNAQ